MTKILGGLCGTLLVFLLGGWAAEIIYHGSGGHDEHAQSYVIEVEGGEGGEETADAGPSFEEVYASADAAAGEALWRNCRSCHALEPGENGTGPTLYGVVGREVASVPDFTYSGALVQVADVWDPAHLNGFLENPKGYAPGTAMGYNGMRKVEDRANLIAYLDSVDD